MNVQTAGVSECASTCIDNICEGKPDRPEACLEVCVASATLHFCALLCHIDTCTRGLYVLFHQANGMDEYSLHVNFLGSNLDPTSYATLFISFSVIFQSALLVCLLGFGAGRHPTTLCCIV